MGDCERMRETARGCGRLREGGEVGRNWESAGRVRETARGCGRLREGGGMGKDCERGGGVGRDWERLLRVEGEWGRLGEGGGGRRGETEGEWWSRREGGAGRQRTVGKCWGHVILMIRLSNFILTK